MELKGRFVSLEGPEGAGKSTQLKILSKHLDSLGYKHIVTRDPGGTGLGRQLRRILLHAEGPVFPMAELLLYEADRAQHVEEVIIPALQKGLIVFCDRYIDSTCAYQGYGRGIDLKLIEDLNQRATSGLKPELTLLFDIESEAGLSRLHPNGHDRLEREEISFHHKVRNGYLALAKAEPERFCVIDAARAMSAVQDDIRKILASRLNLGLLVGSTT